LDNACEIKKLTLNWNLLIFSTKEATFYQISKIMARSTGITIFRGMGRPQGDISKAAVAAKEL